MKLALIGAVVTKITGTEFADGQRVVKVGLEDGYSFNVPENSQLITKIKEGDELDMTYNVAKPNKSTTTSGAEFTFYNLGGVKVIAVRPGSIDETIANLPDAPARTIVFKVVGGGTSGGTTGEVGKV